MDLGGKHGIWAVEIKRSTVPKISKGFHVSINDIKPSKAFIVYAGDERYPKGKDIEAIGLTALCAELRKLTI